MRLTRSSSETLGVLALIAAVGCGNASSDAPAVTTDAGNGADVDAATEADVTGPTDSDAEVQSPTLVPAQSRSIAIRRSPLSRTTSRA
jgi:hypothetical protein